MPVIARFYGIIIRMYFQQAEHTPPHIHALFGEDMAAVALETRMVLEGHLPPKAMSMVKKMDRDSSKSTLADVEDTEIRAVATT